MDTSDREVPLALRDTQSLICLLVAGILLLFSNGQLSIPLAAWLAPVFLLRFVRRQGPKTGLAVAYVVLVTAHAFQFLPMVLLSTNLSYFGALIIVFVLGGFVLLAPYAVDRLVVHKLGALTGSLVFPISHVIKEYLLSFGPVGSWGSIAYSQYGELALLQLLSVTGLWGITFLIFWFAAVCNLLWEAGLESKGAGRIGLLLAGTISVVMLWGGARMAMFPPSSHTVRVASLSKRVVEPQFSAAASLRMRKGEASTEDLNVFRRWSAASNDDLLSRAEQEMRAGAKIVLWGEGNAQVLQEEEKSFVGRGRELATKYQVYFGMAVVVWHLGDEYPIENKVVLVLPNGDIAWEYHKTHPAPVIEAPFETHGDGNLRYVDTPYGRVSSVICADADYPQLLAQAGAMRADFMFVPSNDWQAIAPWHTQMASFRAIEQGTNLTRPASLGLSGSYDYQGRPLAAVDYFRTGSYAMIAEVPTKGVGTVYSVFGDWLAWTCMAGLPVLIARRKQAVRTA